MSKVNVVIVDATGNKEQKVGLPDDIKCGIIMVKLIEKIKLPSVGPDGNPISYKFIHKVTGRQLLEAQTLADAGIKDGDVLRLQPEITAGAICPNCGNAEADGNTFCSKCGTQMPSTPGGFVPAQTYTPYVPVKSGSDKSKTILILGIVAAALYILARMILCLGDVSYSDDSYNFWCFLSYVGEGLFFLTASLFMSEKLKK